MIGRRSASNAQKRGLGRFQRWLASTSGGRSSLGTSSAEKLLRRTSASQVSRHIVDGGMQVTPYVGRKRLGAEVWGVRRVLSGVLWVLTCCCAQHVRVRPRSTTWTVSSLLPIDAPGLAHRGQERRPVRGDRGTRRACVQWSCGLGPSMLHRGFTPQSSSRIGINRGEPRGRGSRPTAPAHTHTSDRVYAECRLGISVATSLHTTSSTHPALPQALQRRHLASTRSLFECIQWR